MRGRGVERVVAREGGGERGRAGERGREEWRGRVRESEGERSGEAE